MCTAKALRWQKKSGALGVNGITHRQLHSVFRGAVGAMPGPPLLPVSAAPTGARASS